MYIILIISKKALLIRNAFLLVVLATIFMNCDNIILTYNNVLNFKNIKIFSIRYMIRRRCLIIGREFKLC